MSRYIDAEYVKAVMINDRLMQGNAEFNLYAQQVEIQINAMPSIDIVRCKECKHNPWNTDADYTCIWDDDFADREQTPDDFCSYGEREGE